MLFAIDLLCMSFRQRPGEPKQIKGARRSSAERENKRKEKSRDICPVGNSKLNICIHI